MKLWIARDKNGGLKLFKNKPFYKILWRGLCLADLNYTLFPEVTFENSPQKVELKLVEE